MSTPRMFVVFCCLWQSIVLWTCPSHLGPQLGQSFMPHFSPCYVQCGLVKECASSIFWWASTRDTAPLPMNQTRLSDKANLLIRAHMHAHNGSWNTVIDSAQDIQMFAVIGRGLWPCRCTQLGVLHLGVGKHTRNRILDTGQHESIKRHPHIIHAVLQLPAFSHIRQNSTPFGAKDVNDWLLQIKQIWGTMQTKHLAGTRNHRGTSTKLRLNDLGIWNGVDSERIPLHCTRVINVDEHHRSWSWQHQTVLTKGLDQHVLQNLGAMLNQTDH